MRVTILLIALVMLMLPGISYAKDKKDDKGLEVLLDMLGKAFEMAGDRVEGDTEESAVEVDGDDNEITRIDTLTININIGDVTLGGSRGGMNPDIEGKFREFMGRMHGPMGNGPDGGMDGHRMRMPGPDGHPGGMGGTGEHPGRFEGGFAFGMPGSIHSSDPERMNTIMQRMEIFSQIPPEVDADFIRFIMHVGELAWKHPEFRERLEQMVHRMENAAEGQHRDH